VDEGVGCRVQGVGCRVWGVGCGVQGVGLRGEFIRSDHISCSRSENLDAGLEVWGWGGFAFLISGFEFGDSR